MFQVEKTDDGYYISDTQSKGPIYGFNEYLMDIPFAAPPPGDCFVQEFISVVAFLADANINMADFDLKDLKVTDSWLVAYEKYVYT